MEIPLALAGRLPTRYLSGMNDADRKTGPGRTTYLSRNVHGGVRPGDKADGAALMALARRLWKHEADPE